MLGAHRHKELRRRAIELVESELERLREGGPEALRTLVGDSPLEAEHDGLTLTTRVDPEGPLLLVLVEAWRERRTLATGGFAMYPDGTAHTPH